MAEVKQDVVEDVVVIDHSEIVKSMEEKAAAELAAHVAAVEAEEKAALAKSAELFPEYHAAN